MFADPATVAIQDEEDWKTFGVADAGRVRIITYDEAAAPGPGVEPWEGGQTGINTDHRFFELPADAFDWTQNFRLVGYKFSPAQNVPVGGGSISTIHSEGPMWDWLNTVDIAIEWDAGGMQLETLAIG